MVRVLLLNISSMECDYPQLYAAATPERKLRSEQYRNKADALRCLAADALLRFALGTADYQTETGPQGKPRITGRPDFHYNLSHSGDWVVLACSDSEVGVDVEKIRMDPGKENIARRCFTPDEQAYVFEDPELTAQRFFRIWTGKESYLKYLGTGLAKSLASFSILSPELCVRISHRTLPGGYSLSLCAKGDRISFELPDGLDLI